MASVWIRHPAHQGRQPPVPGRVPDRRPRAGARFAGSFTTKRLATIRAGFVEQELAAGRIPDLDGRQAAADGADVRAGGRTWRASRVDVAASTSDQHRIQIEKLLPLIGTSADRHARARRRSSTSSPSCTAQGVARETIRKTLGAGAMVLDHAGIAPNPARDRVDQAAARGARGDQPAERRATSRPSTGLIPAKHRLPLLWLDWSGARVSSVDLTLVGDYDEPGGASGCGRRRRRPARRSGSSCRPTLAERARGVAAAARGPRPRRAAVRLERRRRAPHLDREGVQGGRDPALVTARPAPPADLAAASARRAVGADRRVRRPARPRP